MARLALKILNSAMAIDTLRGSRRHEFDDTADDRARLAATRFQAMACPELSRDVLSLQVNSRTLAMGGREVLS
jgi:hypothetical protein